MRYRPPAGSMRKSEIGPGGLRVDVHSARIQPAPTCAQGTCCRLPCCPAGKAGTTVATDAAGEADLDGAANPPPAWPVPLDPQPATNAATATQPMAAMRALQNARPPRCRRP